MDQIIRIKMDLIVIKWNDLSTKCHGLSLIRTVFVCYCLEKDFMATCFITVCPQYWRGEHEHWARPKLDDQMNGMEKVLKENA